MDERPSLGTHQQTERFRIESTANVFFDESNLFPEQEFDVLDIHLKLDATKCVQKRCYFIYCNCL